MIGYAETSKNNARQNLRDYVESLARSKSNSESTIDLIGGADQCATLSTVSVLLDGRPRWSDSKMGEVTARNVIEAYLHRGYEFLGRLNGSFALSLFDRRSGELTLAVDRMGIETMAWAAESAGFTFSSSPAELAHGPDTSSTIRAQAIYDYFFFHMVPGPDSIFSGVRKLEPGVALTCNRSGTREWTYWTPNFDRSAPVHFEDLKAEVHVALREAVQAEYSGPTTGAFLSGGLDSSTVTGFLSQTGDGPAHTFSIGFGVESFNELEYARITNSHFGCIPHEYEVTPDDIVRAIPVVAAGFDEPFGNSSAIPTLACARFAKSIGMTRLLAGDGGDEIFAGNERYARQKVFELFNRIPAPMRRAFQHLVSGAIPVEHPVTALRKLRSYIDQASIPLPERYESWNFVYREGAKVMFCEDFMATIDTTKPMLHMKAVYDSAPSNDLVDKMLFYDWRFTLADNDLRKVVTTCRVAGIEVGFPMLDNRVVDASIAVPSALKMKGLELRTFFKRAMRGFLPPAVLTKSKHGFGLPFGQWLKSDGTLAELVYGSLSDLKKRAIVRSSFIDQLIEGHRSGHAGYYGYVIWDLVILEEWFKHQATRAASKTPF